MPGPQLAHKSLVPRFRWGTIGPLSHASGSWFGADYQFYHIVPPDVLGIFTTIAMESHAPEHVNAAVDARFIECVKYLKRDKVDRIILGGSPVSAQLGRAKVLSLLSDAETEAGVPGDTPLEAVIAAMGHLGLTRLAVASRWDDQLNEALAKYFNEGGIDVVGITTRGQHSAQAAAMSLEEGLQISLDVGREAASSFDNAEAIFVPGGQALSLHTIPALEDEFGKPVFTNLSAEVWHGLVHTGVIDPLEDWGKLLNTV